MSAGYSRVVPIVPATNQQHLEMLAGDQWPNILVASYIGDPEDPTLDPASWRSAPAGTCLHEPYFDAGNTFFCPTSFHPGVWRRQGLAQAKALHGIIIDDVGDGTSPKNKIDLASVISVLRCGPTYLIETSPGNFQAGWKATGMTNMAWVKGMLVRLDLALGGKADNLVNPIAWRRLPVGRNMKASLGLGPQGWRVRQTLLRPDRGVDTLDFLDLDLGGTIVPMNTLSRGTGDGTRPDAAVLAEDPVFQALEAGGRVVGEKITSDRFWAVTIRCPWIADHGPTRPESGAEYVPAVEGHAGWFHCFHCEHRGRGMAQFHRALDEALRAEGQKIVAAFEFDPLPWAAAGTKTSVGRALASYEATEDGLARAFADQHADQLRFDHTRERWFCWTGGFWWQDEVQHAFRWTLDLLRAFREGLQDATAAQLRTFGKIAMASAIERAARANPQLAVSGRDWDQDPWRAGAPGCEINLRTGEVEDPDPKNLITKQLLVAPMKMPTPIWDQFLRDSTGDDPEMIRFLQAWSGYCLTGDVSEERFVFLYGPGGNGKGTFLFTITSILHDYAARTPVELFMLRKHDVHPEHIARLAGVRTVVASEIQAGQTFNVVRLKDFTGRDGKLSGEFKYGHVFEFMAQFKAVFVGNDQPRLPGVDDAIKRRLVLLPFTQKPPTVDITLKDRLRDEYPGILQWMIEGENLRRAMGGLAALVPSAAVAATRIYLDEQDLFRAWVEDRCRFGPGDQMTVGDGFEDYRAWCLANDCQPEVGERQFSRKFLGAFPQCQLAKLNSGTRTLVGVSLSPQDV